MRIDIPELSVVALIGASGCGKTTFARRHFKPTEILSADFFRALVSDDESDQSATTAAFDSLYYVANKRLDAGRLVVIDATNVQKHAREQALRLARAQDCFAVAIVLDFPEALCLERNNARADRSIPPHVVRGHIRDLKRSLRHLQKEGFRRVYVLHSPEEADAVEITRERLWTNRREDTGPFDIIGDVHGCYDELCALLVELGYRVDAEQRRAVPPEGRRAVFLGDLCDRGPKNEDVLRFVMDMVAKGHALCVAGNHDVKLLRHLRGAGVKPTHGLDGTIAALEGAPPAFLEAAASFLDGLISHYVLDDGRLAVAHAGVLEKYQGRSSGRVRSFCLYGETTGETDAYGLPARLNWAEAYRGKARVVFGHTPLAEVAVLNNTYCIDTGCVFGGKLTCYRYPEGDIVQVPALAAYAESARPLHADSPPQSAPRGDVLDISDVQGARRINVRLLDRPVLIHRDRAPAALEIMSRYAADPRWLIYLPPTMSPCETSPLDAYLEHPAEAFDYFGKAGVSTVVCQQKHMGSRAVIVLCRNADAARARFGVSDGSAGLIYTRTGRHFFDDRQVEEALLSRLRAALDQSGFWRDFATDWACLDAELMPWSAKAQALIETQYAPVGRSGRDGLDATASALSQTLARGADAFAVDDAASGQNADLARVLGEYQARQDALARYTDAYRRYCWPVASVDDYRVAPFHILATEGRVWHDTDHLRQMEAIREYMTAGDPVFIATDHIAVRVDDAEDVARGIRWWDALTGAGGEGMVVKPLPFIARKGREVLQPAVKCRGPEYLRIIYGPEYMLSDHLARLKKRSLGRKRRLAVQEFALGMEALERFVQKEPLYRVHECVFGVLALESEPVDPRL